MPVQLSFHDFVFDRRDRRLTRAGRRVELRPKTALLLGYLLEERERLAGKDELILAVWGHAHVEDQALFQLISELRAALGDKNCVRTYPNRGYQWAWPAAAMDRGRAPRWHWRGAAAVFGLLAIVGISLVGSRFGPREPDSPIAAVSPAVDALARAVEARARGDLERAGDYLKTAIGEHPRFASAKLEMAETLRLQGRLMAAQGYAHDALSDARLGADAYMEVAAHLLLSRLRWQQGDLKGALQFNSAAGEMARERQFMCAAELSNAMDRLLIQALTSPGAALGPPTLVQQSMLAGCNRSSLWRDTEAGNRPPELLSGELEIDSISST